MAVLLAYFTGYYLLQVAEMPVNIYFLELFETSEPAITCTPMNKEVEDILFYHQFFPFLLFFYILEYSESTNIFMFVFVFYKTFGI
jgi:hypothetical protein